MVRKREVSKSSNKCMLDDGSMRFIVKLPPETSKLFLEEMKLQDRKMLPLARYIIQRYFREQERRREFEAFTELQASKGQVPHFGTAHPRRRSAGD